MAESDSDDELMRALQGHGQPEECAYCQTEGATFPCTKCNSVVESESEYEDDDDDDEEEEKADALNRRRSGRGSALFRGSSQVFQSTHTCIYLWNAHESVDGSGSMMIPGLTEEQIAQLVKLSSKSTDVLKSSNEISGLKAQLEEMMKSQVNMQELAGRVTTMQQTQETQQQQQQQASSTSSTLLQKSASLKQHELEKLMHKLEALEQRANFSGGGAPPTSSSSSTMPPMMMMMPPPPPVVIYTPLLVQNDDKFKKYFKLLKMAMPVDQIKAKMEVEGVPPALLDTPTAISPNDPGVLAAEKYTEKADVFSFGVVCWETVTRACPYDGLSQIQAALGVLNHHLRPTIPAACPPFLKKLMTVCWGPAPEKRPTFAQIIDMLNAHSSSSSNSLIQMG
ncbi:hypothetical protein DYB35_000463 [Aphanomyces astaci]|uniref:Tyrosine-protein kinase catalytic domain-containing protein n=2 Tax=Aphanomyces astaci TaxID=112090 RepID=A0A3R7BPT8_APHAT|nr:hypothetical protein DYB35_000463 [Aphanomyces astaci]